MAQGHKTGGRKKGTPNKSTAQVREAIALFAEANVGRLQEWLDVIAEDDPGKAVDVYIKLLEYHVPKLSRSDDTVTVEGITNLTVTFPQVGRDSDG